MFFRVFRSIFYALIILGIVLLNILALTEQGRTTVNATFFATQILPIKIKPMEWITPKPIREELEYITPTGRKLADIYRVDDSKQHPGILVFLGVNPAPRNDDRVVELGNALARVGFVAMFSWSEAMIQKSIEPSEVDDLVHAFKQFQQLPYVEGDKVGIGGFCVGGSIAIMAAAHTDISHDVQFVTSFGGYNDLGDLLVQIASHESLEMNAESIWVPSTMAIQLFTSNIVGSLTHEKDRTILNRRFIEGYSVTPLEKSVLSSEGIVAYNLIHSANNMKTENLNITVASNAIDLLPESLQNNLEALSPSTIISKVKADVFLAHDTADDNIPVGESRRLAKGLVNSQTKLTEFAMFDHVTPDSTIGVKMYIREGWKLFSYLYDVLYIVS